MTLVMTRLRTNQMQGNPTMSRKLRVPTLAWMGWGMQNHHAAAALDVPLNHFSDWLSNECKILSDDAQRKILAHPGIMAKKAEIEAKGVIL